jgi:hypothetical protein
MTVAPLLWSLALAARVELDGATCDARLPLDENGRPRDAPFDNLSKDDEDLDVSFLAMADDPLAATARKANVFVCSQGTPPGMRLAGVLHSTPCQGNQRCCPVNRFLAQDHGATITHVGYGSGKRSDVESFCGKEEGQCYECYNPDHQDCVQLSEAEATPDSWRQIQNAPVGKWVGYKVVFKSSARPRDIQQVKNEFVEKGAKGRRVLVMQSDGLMSDGKLLPGVFFFNQAAKSFEIKVGCSGLHRAGCKAEVHGIEAKPHFNGQKVTLVEPATDEKGQPTGRWFVDDAYDPTDPHNPSKRVSFKPDNLKLVFVPSSYAKKKLGTVALASVAKVIMSPDPESGGNQLVTLRLDGGSFFTLRFDDPTEAREFSDAIRDMLVDLQLEGE